MRNRDKAIEVLDEIDLAQDWPWPENETYISALADAGLLAPDLPEPKGTAMSDQQIIRTVEELDVLDHETALMRDDGEIASVTDWLHDADIVDSPDIEIFPLVVIATGSQARAARKALEEENE